MKNQRRMAALMVVALAVVIATGGLVASNMGFKLNKPLLDSNNSRSGTQSMAVPFNPQVGLANLADLFADIGHTVPAPRPNACATLNSVARYNTAVDSLDLYACGDLFPNPR